MSDVSIEEKNGEELDLIEQAGENPAVDLELLREMIQAGVWYGHKRNKTHPRMRQFIFTARNGIEIIDLTKTVAALETAIEFLKSVIAKGEQILFVGTQPAAKHKVEELAKKLKQPFVVNRWLGGILTNFTTLSKRVEYFKKLKADQASGALEKYTKKERLDFSKQIERLKTFFSGIETMAKLPSAIFVVNAKIHNTTIREANKMNIAVAALISTDTNPGPINYPIPGNDSAPTSIEWILNRVEKALEEVKAAQPITDNKQPS